MGYRGARSVAYCHRYALSGTNMLLLAGYAKIFAAVYRWYYLFCDGGMLRVTVFQSVSQSVSQSRCQI